MFSSQTDCRFLPFGINMCFLLYIVLLRQTTYGQEIVLCDNTPKGTVITKEILPRTYSDSVTLSLLQTKASKYFTLDKRNGQLTSSRDIDRDQMCAESGLCCLSQTDNAAVASSRFIHFHHRCITCSPSVPPYDPMTDLQVCAFNLSVSLVTMPGQQPDVYEVTIHICEENDHAPEFKLINANAKSNDQVHWKQTGVFSTSPRPLSYIVNISESVPVGHRIPLPLADDVDAPPFNVQRYEIAHFSASSSIASENPFRLNVIWNDVNRNIGGIQTSRSVLRLELIVNDALDRERIPQYTFKLLAIDGGKPEKTGTLNVVVRILDANDHPPQFDQPVYEATVDEGVAEQKVVAVRAVDQDEGVNAVIRYDWPEGSDWIDGVENRNLIDTSSTRRNKDKMRSLPPGYWFRLDRETGDIFVRHPLDYETQPMHQFKVLAYNPISRTSRETDHSSEIHSSMTTAATVNVKVRNLDDEPPRIVVDYSNGFGTNHVKIKENGIAKYFVAFIRVTDPDLSESASVKSSSLGMQSLAQLNHFGGTPRITCELASDRDYYILEEKRGKDVGNSGEVRYVLSTRRPLDRERSTEDHVRVVCQDSGSPPKNATATAVVRIIDENDCGPKVEVYSVGSSSASSLRGLPLDPWLTQKLRYWIKSHINSPLLTYSPILPAYLANVPIYTVHIPENQPGGTVFARLRAKDKDAGENGRVTFEIAKTSVVVNVTDKHLSHGSLNDKLDITKIMSQYPLDGTVALTSNSDIFTYFELDYVTGDLKTRRIIDREEEHMLIDQLFAVIQASDHGTIPKSTVLVLHIIVDDENDNPPVFSNPLMEFVVQENVSAPLVVGDIFVNDPDIHRPSMLPDEDTDTNVHNKMPNRLRLRIDHDHRDLPFTLIQTSTSGHFQLKTTRVLDRESEEAYQFRIIATDLGPTQYHSNQGGKLSNGLLAMNRREHSATASVLVTVQDVNDNKPEIIFPKPSNSNSTIHRVSYRERAGCEIVSVNAKDQDASDANHRVHFELNLNEPRANDLFTIDANSGLLKTRRRMTKADIGEYTLHITVADGGHPPLKTQLLLRLAVVSSEPHWKCAMLEQVRPNVLEGQPPYGQPESSADWKFNDKEQFSGSHNLELADGKQSFGQMRLLQTDVMLSVFAVLIFLLLLIMVSLCFCLRYQCNIFTYLPDICSTCLRRSSDSNRETENKGQKHYAKNINRTNKSNHLSEKYNDRPDASLMTNLLTNDTGRFKESGHQHRNGSFDSISHVSPSASFLSSHPHNQPMFHSAFNVNHPYSGYVTHEQGQNDLLMNSHCGLPYSNTMVISPDQGFNPIMQNFRPATSLAVNIPDVADQVDIRHKQSYASGYGHPVRPCMETIQSPTPCSFQNDFPSRSHHMYNVGQMRVGSNKLTQGAPETIYFTDMRHDGLVSPRVLFDGRTSEVAFRPIQDDLHLYQRIHPVDDYSTKDQLQCPAPIKSPSCFTRPLITGDNNRAYTTKQLSTATPDQGLVEWRSDPSLNHFTSYANHANSLTYYEKAAECELVKYANTMKISTTRLKRFNSSKQSKRPESRTTNTPYYSALHQSTRSTDPFKSTLSSSIVDSKVTNSTDKAKGDNYAVSFPQIQSSFV